MIRGDNSTDAPVLLAVHKDMPHFICSAVNGDGTVSLSSIGIPSPVSYANVSVISENGHTGFIISEKDKADAFVGKGSDDIHIGDTFRIKNDLLILSEDLISASGLSVAVPTASLLACAEALAQNRPSRNVYLAFTEEGQYDHKQYYPVAAELDVPEAVCVGSVERDALTDECGVIARLWDKSFAADKPLSDKLIACGASPAVLTEGGCAALRVQVNGIPCAQLDIPVRYMGGARECVSLSDAALLTDVILKFCCK